LDTLTHYVPGYFIKYHTNGFNFYLLLISSIGREFNETRKDCPQMRTVGYKGCESRLCTKWRWFTFG